MDKTLGAYAIRAAQQALDDAGISADEVDGLLVCPENMAGDTGGSRIRLACRSQEIILGWVESHRLNGAPVSLPLTNRSLYVGTK